MKSFTTIVENETDTTDLELDSVVIKQMNELKKKIGTDFSFFSICFKLLFFIYNIKNNV